MSLASKSSAWGLSRSALLALGRPGLLVGAPPRLTAQLTVLGGGDIKFASNVFEIRAFVDSSRCHEKASSSKHREPRVWKAREPNTVPSCDNDATKYSGNLRTVIQAVTA